MTTNRRYADAVDQRDTGIDRTRPVTLPQQAYGPQEIEWVRKRPPVWAWVQWPDKPAERIPAYAHGWNDRVVVITWQALGGERSCVVWRNAVTRRTRGL